MGGRVVVPVPWVRHGTICVVLLVVLIALAPLGSVVYAQQTATPSDHGYRGNAQESTYTGSFSDLAVAIDRFWSDAFRANGRSTGSPPRRKPLAMIQPPPIPRSHRRDRRSMAGS
jgi:hypothetical protein